MTLLATRNALFDEARGEVDWVSELSEESDQASENGWDPDDEPSAEDHQDVTRAHVANEPATPASQLRSCTELRL